MNEHPILFNAPMVRAILDDKKTMTRRVQGLEEINLAPDAMQFMGWVNNHALFGENGVCDRMVRCPYGVIGDQFYVRETWATSQILSGLPPARLVPGAPIEYRVESHMGGLILCDRGKWRPSIHMPRWASRISLEITGGKVERLQDIIEEDAVAEGVKYYGHKWIPKGETTERIYTARDAFFALWDSIYASRGCGVKENPWVFVNSFRRL